MAASLAMAHLANFWFVGALAGPGNGRAWERMQREQEGAAASTIRRRLAQLPSGDTQYTVTLDDIGSTTIDTFWFAWVPGQDSGQYADKRHGPGGLDRQHYKCGFERWVCHSMVRILPFLGSSVGKFTDRIFVRQQPTTIISFWQFQILSRHARTNLLCLFRRSVQRCWLPIPSRADADHYEL